jgi:hypothetical protein
MRLVIERLFGLAITIKSYKYFLVLNLIFIALVGDGIFGEK